MSPRMLMLLVALLAAVSLGSRAALAADEDSPESGAGAPIADFRRWAADLAFSPDGSRLVAVGGDSLLFRPGFVQAWDVASGETVAAYGGHEACVWSVAIGPGGDLIATDYNGQVLIHASDGGEPRTLGGDSGAWVRASAISPTGEVVAIGDERGVVSLYSLPGGEAIREFTAHEGAVYDLAFSGDGASLASAGTDGIAKLWTWQDAEADAVVLSGHGDAVWAIAFALDDQTIASCGADRMIRLWRRDGTAGPVLEGHQDWVTDVAISPSGEELASCDQDGVVRLWRLPDGAPLGSIDDLADSAWSIAYSPGGDALAVGGHDSGVRLYEKSWRVRLMANDEP